MSKRKRNDACKFGRYCQSGHSRLRGTFPLAMMAANRFHSYFASHHDDYAEETVDDYVSFLDPDARFSDCYVSDVDDDDDDDVNVCSLDFDPLPEETVRSPVFLRDYEKNKRRRRGRPIVAFRQSRSLINDSLPMTHSRRLAIATRAGQCDRSWLSHKRRSTVSLELNELYYRPVKRRRRGAGGDDMGLNLTLWPCPTRGPSAEAINCLFDCFAADGRQSDALGCAGIRKLRLALDMEECYSFRFFLLVYKFEVESRFSITRAKFCYGCYYLGVDTLRDLDLRFRAIESRAYRYAPWDRVKEIKKFFTFSFRYQLDSPRSRTLHISVATNTMNSIMRPLQSPFLGPFITFVRKRYQWMTLDQFKIFFDFVKTVKDDFVDYDVAGSWPTMYDEFYLWYSESYVMDTGADVSEIKVGPDTLDHEMIMSEGDQDTEVGA